MKKAFLALFVGMSTLCCSAAFAHDDIIKSEPQLWETLHNGHFSLGHKMVLTRPAESTNDEIMGQFMMAYLYYKIGKSEEEIIAILKGVDSYVTHHYFPATE